MSSPDSVVTSLDASEVSPDGPAMSLKAGEVSPGGAGDVVRMGW